MAKHYKLKKRGAGRHVQLMEWFQSTEAWATMKPGPRALYVELKRRYNGSNNGGIYLSHREAACLLSVTRNTASSYFLELQRRGFIRQTRAHCLGPSGIGESSRWALEELVDSNGQPATKSFARWCPPKSKSQPKK